MKPFNLEAAKRGEKVVTRDGREAEIAYFDMSGSHPLQGRVKNVEGWYPCFWNNAGVASGNNKTLVDLFMAPVKQKLWLVIWSDNTNIDHIGCIYSNKEAALLVEPSAKSIEVEVEL